MTALMADNNRRWFVLAAMGGVLGLIALDQTVVGVALPTIRDDLAMSSIASHWVVNSYLLVMAGFAAAAGRIGDLLSLRSLFLAGAALFGSASVFCGLAESGDWIIAARAVQGLGAAMIFPTSITMIARSFPEEQRGLAFGIQTMVGASFMSAGPLVGGVLIHYASWRWIFWVNLPVLLIVITLVLLAWEKPPKKIEPKRLHVTGLLLLVLALSTLITAIMQGEDWGWRSLPILVLFALGIAIMAIFVKTELRRDDALLDLRLLRIPVFAASNLTIWVGQFSVTTVTIFCAMMLQQKAHFDALQAGIYMLAAVLPTLFTSLLAGLLADRFGTRTPILIGIAANCVALLWVAYLDSSGSYREMHWPLILWGLSLPMVFVPARRAVMSSVPVTRQGQASGVSLTLQLLGGTMSIAVCGTLLVITNSFTTIYLTAATLIGLVWIAAFVLIERGTR